MRSLRQATRRNNHVRLNLGRARRRDTQQGFPAAVFPDSAEACRDTDSEHAQGVQGDGEAAHQVRMLGMAHSTDGTSVRQAGEHSATGFEDNLSRTVIQRSAGDVWTTHIIRDRRESLCRQFFLNTLRPGHRLHHLLPERRQINYNLRINSKLPPLSSRHERFKWTRILYGLTHLQ